MTANCSMKYWSLMKHWSLANNWATGGARTSALQFRIGYGKGLPGCGAINFKALCMCGNRVGTADRSGGVAPATMIANDHPLHRQLRKGPRISAGGQASGRDGCADHVVSLRRKPSGPLRPSTRSSICRTRPASGTPDTCNAVSHLARSRDFDGSWRWTISMSSWRPCCASTCDSREWARPPPAISATSYRCDEGAPGDGLAVRQFIHVLQRPATERST